MVHLIPCTLHHLPALQRIALQAYQDHYLYLWLDGGAWYIQRSFSETILRQELEDAQVAFYLVYNDEEPVGFLKLNLHRELEGEYSAADALELERIYLLASAAGKGIGRQVLAFTQTIARKYNKRVVWLKAMDSSRSVNFYEQNGFEKCGTYTLPFEQMKPEYRGMYVMRQLL